MADKEKEFELKRVKDLLASNSSVNMNIGLSLSEFNALLDKLVV